MATTTLKFLKLLLRPWILAALSNFHDKCCYCYEWPVPAVIKLPEYEFCTLKLPIRTPYPISSRFWLEDIGVWVCNSYSKVLCSWGQEEQAIEQYNLYQWGIKHLIWMLKIIIFYCRRNTITLNSTCLFDKMYPVFRTPTEIYSVIEWK